MSPAIARSLRLKHLLLISAILSVLAFAGGYYLRGGTLAPPPETASMEQPDTEAPTAPEIWTCSMHPQIRQPNPGLCPICAMDLIPATTEDDTGSGAPRQISVSPAAAALMNVSTVPVRRVANSREVTLLGRIAGDERRLATISAWVPGRIERMHVDFTGAQVAKGEPMVTLYSPELLAARAELRTAQAALGRVPQQGSMRAAAEANLEAARAKLRRWGISESQISGMAGGRGGENIQITAPISGTVIERLGQEGMYVETGAPIYVLYDLGTVWVNLDAYESDLGLLRVGDAVRFTAEAIPGEVFTGAVEFIEPIVNPETRTTRVRLTAENPGGRLRPDMYVRATVTEAERDEEANLIIPASAALVTGKRALVYVRVPGAERPTFENREVVLGSKTQDGYVVLAGLVEGDEVVVQGNFQLDSAVQIQARPSMMNPDIVLEQWQGRTVVASQSLREQLRKVVDAHEAFQAQRAPQAERDPGLAREQLLQAFAAVSHAELPAESHELWTELDMKIRNDAVAATELEDSEAREEAAARLAQNVALMARVFEVHSNAALQARPVAPAALVPVFDRYFDLQIALAADDFAASTESARALLDAVAAMPGDTLPAGAAEAWAGFSPALRDEVTAVVGAVDIAAMREAFLPLSNTMIALAERMGAPEGMALYVAHCPMANNDAGADWLQRTENVLNPYYGSMMLTCGFIKDTIAAPAGAEGASDE